MRNKSLHREKYKGENRNIAMSHNIPNDCHSAVEAVHHYSVMSPQTTSQFPYMALAMLADVVDDFDQRLSNIEDKLSDRQRP